MFGASLLLHYILILCSAAVFVYRHCIHPCLFLACNCVCSSRAPVRPQCNATAKAVARLFTARPGSLSPLHRARHGPASDPHSRKLVNHASRVASHVYSHDAWRNCCGGIVYCIYMGSATTDERGARVVASVGTVVANALAWCSGWCGLGAGWSWPWVTLPVLRCLPA